MGLGEQAGVMHTPPIASCMAFICLYQIIRTLFFLVTTPGKQKTQRVALSLPFPAGQGRGGITSAEHLTAYRGEVFSVAESEGQTYHLEGYKGFYSVSFSSNYNFTQMYLGITLKNKKKDKETNSIFAFN